MQSGLYVPLKIYHHTLGCISVESDQPDAFNKEDEHLLTTLAVQAAVALENARLFQSAQEELAERKRAEMKIRQQIERLTALSKIDQAIMSSFDLNVTMDILLDQVISQLQVEAADIFLLGPDGQTLEYAAGQGFRTHTIESVRVRMGEGHAGRALQERRLIRIEDLTEGPNNPLLSNLFRVEGFVDYYGVPLIVKGKAIGVLEVFHRMPLHAYSEWLDYLTTLAGQAAIAIENSTLFDNLQSSNRELGQAYDATIEGWSRAMDLRDKETEGHTQRVTRMTLELARAMKMGDEQLIHIRRGALLHDIGKLGVPDHILLKEDKLTDEEWEIMRRHPQFAYDMLFSIKYLEPALKIPYCHHERWDGTGYPRGLKGQQIPLEARIFAVVDVWDALTSDRSYRPAWDVEAARNYIREHAGLYFDPAVVDYFLKTIK
jgi:HD-GYP domain-containing protein (c-di-GMP phosphodiesterase class II)